MTASPAARHRAASLPVCLSASLPLCLSASLPLCWAASPLSVCAARAQPFVDEGHFVQTLFPDWSYAIKIPAVLFVLLVTIIVTFISLVMIKSRKPKSS